MRAALPLALPLALLLGSTTAHADGDWIAGIQAGTVAAHIDYADDYDEGETQWGAGLAVDVSRRIHPQAALGLRLAIGPEITRSDYEHRSMFDIQWDIYYRPIVLGAVASYFPTERTWVSPWVGIEHDWDLCETSTEYHPTRTSTGSCGELGTDGRDTAFAYGVSAGIDLFAAMPHRAGLAASITRARGGEYTSVALSVAYRYW